MSSEIHSGHFSTESALLRYLNLMDRPISIISIFHDFQDGLWKCYYQYLD